MIIQISKTNSLEVRAVISLTKKEEQSNHYAGLETERTKFVKLASSCGFLSTWPMNFFSKSLYLAALG